MKDKLSHISIKPLFWLIAFFIFGCDSNPGPARVSRKESNGARVFKFSELSESDHAEVIKLIRAIYKAALGNEIVSWYETESAAYLEDHPRRLVRFPSPIQTLSVTVPDDVAETEDLEEHLSSVARRTTLGGWRLKQFKLGIDLAGGGGTRDMKFAKITIYPLEVEEE